MWAFLFVLSLLTLCAGHVNAVCGNTPTVWRNDNITCPERAICADVFQTVRDWYNGTRCEEKRVLHHCLCSGSSVCPFNNPDHLLYASAQHLQYTCRPACRLPFCANVGTQRPVNPRTPIVSQTLEQNVPAFGGRNYYKMSCRCPRHHAPILHVPGVHRSVQAHSHVYDYQSHRYSTQYVCTLRGNESKTNNSTQYVCTLRGNENMMSDPCSSSSRSNVNIN